MPKYHQSRPKGWWCEPDIAWAAGFFEGEGGVGQRHVLVSQVNRWPLERLVMIFGGHIGDASRIDKRRLGKSQPLWQWSLCGELGREFVEAIYPYLSPRRQQQIDDVFVTRQKFEARRYSEKQLAHFRRFARDKRTGRITGAT